MWTDAHGVCNYISLARESGDASYLNRADELIDDVHATLGRDRAGRPLGHTDAPLAGGLRIGKVADEDHPDGDGALMPCAEYALPPASHQHCFVRACTL